MQTAYYLYVTLHLVEEVGTPTHTHTLKTENVNAVNDYEYDLFSFPRHVSWL